MIAYVESPFQYLQVIEYIKVKNIDPSHVHLFVRQTHVAMNNQQIKNMVKLVPINYRKITYAKNWVLVIAYGLKGCLTDVQPNTILIGDENSFFTKTMNCFISKTRFIYLDDGAATLNSKKILNRFSIFSKKKSQKNTFAYLSSHFIKQSSSYQKKPAIVMVGAKFIEAKISTFEDYESYLLQISSDLRRDYPEAPTFYIPHRYEGDHLDRLKASVFNKFDIEIIRLAYPIELIQMELEQKILYFVSFFSTALFSLQLLYPETSFCYYELPKQKIRKRQKQIENIYTILAQSGMPRKDLK